MSSFVFDHRFACRLLNDGDLLHLFRSTLGTSAPVTSSTTTSAGFLDDGDLLHLIRSAMWPSSSVTSSTTATTSGILDDRDLFNLIGSMVWSSSSVTSSTSTTTSSPTTTPTPGILDDRNLLLLHHSPRSSVATTLWSALLSTTILQAWSSIKFTPPKILTYPIQAFVVILHIVLDERILHHAQLLHRIQGLLAPLVIQSGVYLLANLANGSDRVAGNVAQYRQEGTGQRYHRHRHHRGHQNRQVNRSRRRQQHDHGREQQLLQVSALETSKQTRNSLLPTLFILFPLLVAASVCVCVWLSSGNRKHNRKTAGFEKSVLSPKCVTTSFP